MSDYRSILAKIDSRGRKAPRVRLRETPEDPGAKPKEIARHQTGRYEVVGEIGSGAVGEVLKAHDVDLGRDVAMKVLRAEHQGNAELIRRFVEEAQVGGQLQHPGIVPVYELGLQADKRPYFAMKLVKGRTMAELLHERKRPADRRRHFLTIFAQVCQTVAYAHSRGVIHRDLKPSNVMVGAFGQVQVVDWGFAKVLPAGGIADEGLEVDSPRIATVRSTDDGSKSIAGSVMGTPAYMPPEQALGRVDEVDERSDVFALGAMLTEILTGGPAYVSESENLLVLAARCQPDDALQRLDACGADPRLVELAKSCLSVLRKDRPDDGAALAAGVTRHLATAEERAQHSKLAAIEARRKAADAQAKAADAKAKSEAARAAAEKEKAKAERARHQAELAAAEADRSRKTRKQMLMLAVAVMAVVLAGGGAFWFVGKGRRARALEIEAQVNRAMEKAGYFKGEQEWSEATLAARQAVGLGGGAHAQAVLDAIEKAKAEADAAAELRGKELAFVALLEEIRLRRADHVGLERPHESYLRAFREFGIDVEKLTVRQAKRKIRAIPEWREVVGALDEWAWLRSESLAAKLTTIVKAVDPDPLRNKLRAAHASGDVPEVSDKLPLRTISLVGAALRSSGDRIGAIRFLRRMREHHPGDLWVNQRLAGLLAQEGQYAEAAGFSVAALALRRESVAIRSQLSESLCKAGEPKAAVKYSHDAVALAPKDGVARAYLAAALVWDGDRTGGLRAYEAALALTEDKAAVHLAFGRALSGLGESDLRLAALNKAVAARPDYFAQVSLGAALRDAGDLKGAVAALRKAVGRNRDGYVAHQALGNALYGIELHAEAVKALRTCIGLRPRDWQAHYDVAQPLNALRDYDAAQAAAEKALKLAPTRAEPHLSIGFTLLGQGELRPAAKAFYKALPLGGVAYQGLGYALAAMGDLEQAEIATREAVRLDPNNAVALNHLGQLLAQRGDFEGAAGKFSAANAQLALARIVARNDPAAAFEMLESARKAPGAMRVMGLVRMGIDDLDGAVEILREALADEIKSSAVFSFDLINHRASTWFHLGHAYMRKGELEQALAAFNKSDDLGESGPHWTKPTSLLIGECEELLAAEDTITLAKRRYYERKWAESVSLFEKAFEEGVEGERLVAARAAARVGQRDKAFAWLHEGLKRIEQRLDYRAVDERREARGTLLELFDLPDFRPYRSERLLKRIPEPERGEWRAFWVKLRLALLKPRPLS